MFSLSTTCIEVPQPPEAILDRLRVLSSEVIETIALDPRLPLEVMRQVARGAMARRLRVNQLSPPQTSRSASAISEYRDERRRCIGDIIDAVELAAQWDVEHVSLGPWSIAGVADPAALRHAHTLGHSLPFADLEEGRRVRGAGALDRVRSLLDTAFGRADGLGRRILLTAPVPFLWATPNASELQLLRQEFSGAPLDIQLRLDWAHQREALEGASNDSESHLPADFERLVVADACGLDGGLPLGCGELEVARYLKADTIGTYPVLLSFQPGIRTAEVLQSMTRWSDLGQGDT